MEKVRNCKTKYPILLVHGIGFRDTGKIGYWGRIPEVLKSQGAMVFHSTQDGWGTVQNNANLLNSHLNQVISHTGATKVNIIAHSKGGLDSRYLASIPDVSHRIASITTISTPHHGSKTMDFIMKFPSFLIKFIGLFINGISKLAGDNNPDFYETCLQLTTKHMDDFNERISDAEGVYYQSYCGVMTKPTSDIIMMLQNLIVGIFDGENDGLVSPDSANWGEFKGVLVGTSKRGVSHTDVVDLRRRPLVKFGSKYEKDISSEISLKLTKKDHKYIPITDITEMYSDIVYNLSKQNF